MAKTPRSTGLLVLLLVIGSIFGTLLGQFLKEYLPILGLGQTIGLDPTTIDLAAITLTLGLTLQMNIATIIGFFIALFIYARL